MSLFDEDIDVVTKKDPIPVIHERKYKSHTVDSRYTPHAKLLTSISGYPWVVDYYSAVIGSDDALDGQSPDRSPVHQQYRRIRAFEIKVSAPLDRTQDTQTRNMQVSGSANVYPCLIPNVGDVFIADIGNGKSGLFSVTESERLSHFSEPVHRINYQLIDELNNAHLYDLERKVVKTLHFRREYLDYGQAPFIEDESIYWVRDLELSYQEILSQYYQQHWSREFSTLVVPGQRESYYDPYIVRAMTGFFLTAENPYFQKIKILNVEEDDVLRAHTVLDVILNREPFDIRSIVRRIGVVSARQFDRLPIVHSIHHSGIKWVIYPADDTVTADYQIVQNKKSVMQFKLGNDLVRDGIEPGVFEDVELEGITPYPMALIHPVLKDDYYIFSEAFYNNTEGQSLLEYQVRQYLDKKSPNAKALMHLISEYSRWGVLEKFYYTPALLTLIFASLRAL